MARALFLAEGSLIAPMQAWRRISLRMGLTNRAKLGSFLLSALLPSART
jgi:hypothetical protein